MIQAGPAHAPLLAALHAAAFPDDPWDEATFATLLEDPHITTLIDERGGFLVLRQILDEAEIITLGATLRRQGIARALIEAALARPGLRVLHLEVAATNTPALALYNALGFQPTGRRRAYYNDGSDALTMSCTIPDKHAAP
jgi:ribosomal-protein-alanine N-acetyltransferase